MAARMSTVITHLTAGRGRFPTLAAIGGSLAPLRTSRIAATDRSSAATVAATS